MGRLRVYCALRLRETTTFMRRRLSQAFAPVARASPQVSDCHHTDFGFQLDEEDGEGKAEQKRSANTESRRNAGRGRRSARRLLNTNKSRIDRNGERFAKARHPLLVPGARGGQFVRRVIIESDRLHQRRRDF